MTITPWKLVGYLGVALFAGRWFVQMYYSRRHGRPVVPTVFWLMSIWGSLLLLSYFIFGKNDSVGHPVEPVPGLRRQLQPLPRLAQEAKRAALDVASRFRLRGLVAAWAAGVSSGLISAGVRGRHWPVGSVRDGRA